MNAVTVIAIGLAALSLTPRVSCKHKCGSKSDLVFVQVHKIAEEWLPRWQIQSGKQCPAELVEVARVMGGGPDETKDAWDQPLGFICAPGLPGDKAFGVYSIGPDREGGTRDDIYSWQRQPPLQ